MQIIWCPYVPPYVQETIPEYCLIASDMWRAVVPILCFHIVEYHQPDRVLRQFHMRQSLPTPAVNLIHCHTLQLRGKQQKNWSEEHKEFIALWDNRVNRISSAPQLTTRYSRTSQYMRWYWRITRRWIHPVSGAPGFVVYIFYN